MNKKIIINFLNFANAILWGVAMVSYMLLGKANINYAIISIGCAMMFRYALTELRFYD